MIPLRDDNPTTIPPIFTVGVIALCALVFLWQQTLSPEAGTMAVYAYGVVPTVLFGNDSLPPDLARIPPELTILTSMFMHGGWMHIIGNMLYLWIFGNNIEDAMGHFKFAIFYLVSGIAAALTMVLVDPASHTPIVGASGAISGVLGAYMLLFPRARIHVVVPLWFLFYPFWVRAVWVVGIWFAMQLATAALTPPSEPGVAWWAHVGGFTAGLLLTPLLKSRDVPYFGPVDYRGPWGRG